MLAFLRDLSTPGLWERDKVPEQDRARGDNFTTYLTLGRGRRHSKCRQHIQRGDNPDRR